MKRLDMKPGHVYRIVPWQGNAATYTGRGAYVRTPAGDDLQTVSEPRHVNWGQSHGGRTLIVVQPVTPDEHDGYQVPTDTETGLAGGIPAARVIDEVCPVADWPKYLERLACQHRENTVNRDAAILKRRGDVELLLACELPGPISSVWWSFIRHVVDMPDDYRRHVAWDLYTAKGSPDLAPARTLIRSVVADNFRGADRRAHKIIGLLSTEVDDR